VSDQDLRKFAEKQLKKKQDFRSYLGVYAGVSVLVTASWFFVSPGAPFWPFWVMFGMGIGALFAGLDAYGVTGRKPITNDEIDAEVERLRRKG
jgi:hypothetical protein